MQDIVSTRKRHVAPHHRPLGESIVSFLTPRLSAILVSSGKHSRGRIPVLRLSEEGPLALYDADSPRFFEAQGPGRPWSASS